MFLKPFDGQTKISILILSASRRKYREPQLRPKGLGLGADTVLKKNQKKAVDKDGKELLIVKNAFVKITTGKFKGCYGKVNKC